MSLIDRIKQFLSKRGLLSILVLLLVGGMFWENFPFDGAKNPAHSFVRSVSGLFYGKHPGPAEQGVVGSLKNRFSPQMSFKLMTIKHIPLIDVKAGMPHPFVGPCQQCHLYRGGPGPGTQFKTPVGAALESFSKIRKLGPPLHPDSDMPHPPAGRCIKCHDIIVKVPANNNSKGPRWVL